MSMCRDYDSKTSNCDAKNVVDRGFARDCSLPPSRGCLKDHGLGRCRTRFPPLYRNQHSYSIVQSSPRCHRKHSSHATYILLRRVLDLPRALDEREGLLAVARRLDSLLRREDFQRSLALDHHLHRVQSFRLRQANANTCRLVQERIHEQAVVHSLLTSSIHRIVHFSSQNDSVSLLDMTLASSRHSQYDSCFRMRKRLGGCSRIGSLFRIGAQEREISLNIG